MNESVCRLAVGVGTVAWERGSSVHSFQRPPEGVARPDVSTPLASGQLTDLPMNPRPDAIDTPEHARRAPYGKPDGCRIGSSDVIFRVFCLCRNYRLLEYVSTFIYHHLRRWVWRAARNPGTGRQSSTTPCWSVVLAFPSLRADPMAGQMIRKQNCGTRRNCPRRPWLPMGS
jgi:hypothetical protein